MLSNAYCVAKLRFDTAENEPARSLQILQKKLLTLLMRACGGAAAGRERERRRRLRGGPRRARGPADPPTTRRVVANFWQIFGKMLLVFGCIGTDFCKQIRVFQHFSKSTILSS